MKMKKNPNSKFIKCECEGEGMGIDFDPECGLYCFSYWYRGLSNRPLSWRERIRYCWRVLTKGKAFEDEVILSQASVNELIDHLVSRRTGFPTGNDIEFGTNME